MLRNHSYFHWLYFDQGKKALFNIGLGLFIWLFLGVSRPFGISESNISSMWMFLFLFPIGMTWVVIAYFSDFVIIRLLKIRIDQSVSMDLVSWMTKILLLVHGIWVIRGIMCSWQCLNLFEYAELWLAMLLLIGLVYLPYSLYARYKYYHSALGHGTVDEDELIIKGDGKDRVRLNLTQTLYIKADDNYVDFIQIGNRKQFLRTSLTSIDKQLHADPRFIRVHRSYIINSQYFESYEKSSGMVYLRNDGRTTPIPVSKSYRSDVETQFVHPK